MSDTVDNKDASSNAQLGQQQIDNRDNRRGGRGSGGASGNRHHRPNQNQSESALNLSELRELADLINHHGFTEFEFENENIRVRLRKDLAPQIIAQPFSAVAAQPQSVQAAQAPATQSLSSANSPAAVQPSLANEDENLHKIISPIVGTFYRSPSPDADPFVKVGSQVTAETIVCIVEAMKLMNEIPAEISGEVVKIYVENGQPVEYGQPLFAVK